MPETLSLDDRQLLVELQSLGVRVVDETAGTLPGRRGGAGPSDAMFLWVRGLPLTVPSHAAFVDASPYTVRVAGRRATLYRDDAVVGPVTLPPRPKIYDMATAGGIPYWKIALLHLDSIASTVVQKVHLLGYAGAVRLLRDRLTRGEQTVPVKTPAMLAEVHGGARLRPRGRRHADDRLAEPPRPRRDYISRCAAAIKEACGMPIQVQFEPPGDGDGMEDGVEVRWWMEWSGWSGWRWMEDGGGGWRWRMDGGGWSGGVEWMEVDG